MVVPHKTNSVGTIERSVIVRKFLVNRPQHVNLVNPIIPTSVGIFISDSTHIPQHGENYTSRRLRGRRLAASLF